MVSPMQGHVMTYLVGALTVEVARAAQFIRRHNTVKGVTAVIARQEMMQYHDVTRSRFVRATRNDGGARF